MVAQAPQSPAATGSMTMGISVQDLLIGDTLVRVSGSGEPIVFVHGFTTTSEFWREQVEPFSRRSRVIRVNLPGHGRSPSPAGRHYRIEDFVGDVERVFRELGIARAILVGLSMGGTIAQHFTLANPSLVRGLVLVGATPHGLGPDVNVDNVHAAIDAHGIATASRNVIDRSFAPSTPAALLDFAKDEVVQTPEFVAREAITSLNASDSRDDLGRITVPTLVVVGDKDTITPPEESRRLAEGIPDSRLVIVEGAGHFPMIEKPEVFNGALREFAEQLAPTLVS